MSLYSLKNALQMKINTKTHSHPLVKKTAGKTTTKKFSNPNVLYSAGGKPYKSTSSGAGWGGEKPQAKKK